MTILVKRSFECEELYDRRFKRCRVMEDLENSINALQQCPSSAAAEEVLAAAAAAALPSSSGECRRRSSDCMDDSPATREPTEKRMRVGSGPSMLERPNVTELGGSNSEASREASIHGWAETVVKSLQGSPSVDEAIRRSSLVLTDMAEEARKAILSEVELTADEPPKHAEDAQELTRVKDMNRILMRGVRGLAERCKRLEGQGDEVVMLRQALEQSQDAQKRLQHSHEVLQGHLRLHLDCSNSDLPWGSAVH